MCDQCNDNRFELIEKFKKKLIESTNIETSPEEMKVIDNILFRFWQMGWLDKLEQPPAEPLWIPLSERPPRGQTQVIISGYDDSGDTPFDYTACGWMTRDGKYWIVDNDIDNFVVAWMPMPKPYKVKKER